MQEQHWIALDKKCVCCYRKTVTYFPCLALPFSSPPSPTFIHLNFHLEYFVPKYMSVGVSSLIRSHVKKCCFCGTVRVIQAGEIFLIFYVSWLKFITSEMCFFLSLLQLTKTCRCSTLLLIKGWVEETLIRKMILVSTDISPIIPTIPLWDTRV